MASKQLLQSAGDGTAVPAGYVGEMKSFIQSAALNIASNTGWTTINAAPILVTKGIWHVFAKAAFAQTGPVTFSEQVMIGYSTDSGSSSFSDVDFSVARINNLTAPIPGSVATSITQSRTSCGGTLGVISVLTDTNYYFKIRNVASAGSYDVAGASLWFVRIA